MSNYRENLRRFLDLLGNDEFRAAFEVDPKAALAKAGLEVDEERIPKDVKLPDKDFIIEAKERLLANVVELENTAQMAFLFLR